MQSCGRLEGQKRLTTMEGELPGEASKLIQEVSEMSLQN